MFDNTSGPARGGQGRYTSEEAAIKVKPRTPTPRPTAPAAPKKPAPRMPAVADGFESNVWTSDAAATKAQRKKARAPARRDGPSARDVNQELAAALRDAMSKPAIARPMAARAQRPKKPAHPVVADYARGVSGLRAQKTADNLPRRLSRTKVPLADRAVEHAMRELLPKMGAPRDENRTLDRAVELLTEAAQALLVKGGMSAPDAQRALAEARNGL